MSDFLFHFIAFTMVYVNCILRYSNMKWVVSMNCAQTGNVSPLWHGSLSDSHLLLSMASHGIPGHWSWDNRWLDVQYIPRNMHTVFALLCFVVVIHWLMFPYPSGLLHWHCGNLTIAPVSAKQPWWIWINTSCEFIMNDCITTTKQSTTKPCAYFLGYTVGRVLIRHLVVVLYWRQWFGYETKIKFWKNDPDA